MSLTRSHGTLLVRSDQASNLLFLKILATTRQINKNFEYGSSDPTIFGLVWSERKGKQQGLNTKKQTGSITV
jgi:hypothetical protein